MSKLTKEQVKHIAYLARLDLDEKEIESYAEQLTEIISYAEKIQELDTENVPPTSHAIPQQNVWREDKMQPSLPPEEAIKNSAETAKDQYFKVPKVTDDVT